MEEEKKEYTHEELSHYTDTDLINLLRSAWGYEPDKPFYVLGRLDAKTSLKGTFYILEQLRNPYDGTELKYPLRSENIRHTVFVGSHRKLSNNKYDFYSEWVKILVELSPKEERDKHKNPFSLRRAGEEVTLLAEISEDIILQSHTIDDQTLIEEWVVNCVFR